MTHTLGSELEILAGALKEILDVPRTHPGLWGGEAADLMRAIARQALEETGYLTPEAEH